MIVTTPNERTLFRSIAGQQVMYVLIACYPTSSDNHRADFPLPAGNVIPHMQAGADPPMFADGAARYPVILFSHGYGGSPISSDHIPAPSIFASHGYVVVAPFHGDARFSYPKIQDFGDASEVLPHFDGFVAFQALRPLSLTTSPELFAQVTSDPRLNAAVGFEPYFRQAFLPAFGRDQHGLDHVTLPYLGISGTADTTAPLDFAQLGI